MNTNAKNTGEERGEIVCPSCRSHFSVDSHTKDRVLQYCPYCGSALIPSKAKTLHLESTTEEVHTSAVEESVTLIQGHTPENENIQFTIGPYQILRNIGKGGMGEVFLAYDTTCGRRIALKRIRTDLVEHYQMHNRFLKEARITSQLTHPSIIPIYSIQGENNVVYYTMPFVEGETLKQILRKTRQQEKKGEKLDYIGGSIPALVRIFINICQAIAYAHSKDVLHRDIKPENVIVGQFGEVLILDWGLAKLIKNSSEANSTPEGPEEREHHRRNHLTHIGKVVGTVNYMAPERAMGNPATYQTDIYSLGVILYQILTLHHPFKRGTLKEFRQNITKEIFVNPVEVAPYRDVPKVLAQIATKCLAQDPEDRYKSVGELIHDLESYIEGRAEWFQAASLDINTKSDWEFQENVLIAEHIAITRGTEITDWVSLMISKESFVGNTKIEARVRIGEKGHGIGFLMSMPEATERVHLNDGYCLWLGSDINKSTKLLRSTVEVMHASDIVLQRHEWYRIRIEKIENNIYFYLNDLLMLSYISHLPLAGTHLGLLTRDADFVIEDFTIYVGSQNITINCLALPDAFLAHKDYATALSEYRRIGYSFLGRAEGREGLFRAGITLLEQARNTPDPTESSQLFDAALEEFEKLHSTPGAPLEYLGKALVYQTLRDYEEELKCFELAFRRYPNHPLLPVLQEQIVYRMHESSRYNRKATYSFLLLTVRHMPKTAVSNNVRKLLNSLSKHWEPLSFFESDPAAEGSENIKNKQYAIQLAFWLAKTYVLQEIVDDLIKTPTAYPITLCNALYCLLELGTWETVEKKLGEAAEKLTPEQIELLRIGILCAKGSIEESFHAFFKTKRKTLSLQEERILVMLMQQAIRMRHTQLIYGVQSQFDDIASLALPINSMLIWAYLLDKNWVKAGEILHQYSLEMLTHESTILHFLYGCWLYITEGKEITDAHFSGALEITYPRTWSLFGHYYMGRLEEKQDWYNKAFAWEKRQLYTQLSLFYDCLEDREKSEHYLRLEKEQIQA